jgi:hypothetical protein
LIQHSKGNDKPSWWRIDSVALFAKDRIKHKIRENIPDKRECDITSEWKTEMKYCLQICTEVKTLEVNKALKKRIQNSFYD